MQITHLRNATVLLEFISPEGRPLGLLVDPMLAPRGSLPALRYLGAGRQRNPIVELPEGTDALLQRVWGEWYGDSHVVEVHMSRLRNKVKKAGGPSIGTAVRGVGYKLGVDG